VQLENFERSPYQVQSFTITEINFFFCACKDVGICLDYVVAADK